MSQYKRGDTVEFTDRVLEFISPTVGGPKISALDQMRQRTASILRDKFLTPLYLHGELKASVLPTPGMLAQVLEVAQDISADIPAAVDLPNLKVVVNGESTYYISESLVRPFP